MDQPRSFTSFRKSALPADAQPASPEAEQSGPVKLEAIQAAKSRTSARSFMVEPVHLRRLVDLWGMARTAEEVGYDITTIQTGLRNDEIRETTEKLAKFMLMAEEAKADQPHRAIVLVPADKVIGFYTVCEAMGVKTTPLDQ